MMQRLAALALAGLAGLLPTEAARAGERPTTASRPKSAAEPEVWLCVGKPLFDLLAPDAEWPFVKEHLSGIKERAGTLAGPYERSGVCGPYPVAAIPGGHRMWRGGRPACRPVYGRSCPI